MIFSPKSNKAVESPRQRGKSDNLTRQSVSPRRHRTPLRKELTAENYSIRKKMANDKKKTPPKKFRQTSQ